MKNFTRRDARTRRDAHKESFHRIVLGVCSQIISNAKRLYRIVRWCFQRTHAGVFFAFLNNFSVKDLTVLSLSRLRLSAPFSKRGHFAMPRFVVPIGVLSLVLLASVFNLGSGVDIQVANAAINEQLNFQARLLTDSGSLVPDGNYHVRFKIYCGGDGEIAGAGTGSDCLHASNEDLLWTETRTTGNLVRVVNGYMSVQLGSVTAFGSSVDWNADELWLSIEIGGSGGSASWDGEMTNSLDTDFMRLTSTPYAFNSNQLDGLDSSEFVQLGQASEQTVNSAGTAIDINQTGAGGLLNLSVGGTDAFTILNSGRVGINDVTPDAMLDVQIGTTSTIGLLIQGIGSQTSDYLQVIDSGGTNEYFSIDSSGNIFFTQLDCTGNANNGALTTDSNGQISCSDDDGGGASGVTSLNSATGALSILGTTNEIDVNTSSPNITLSLPDTVILGDNTNAGILQLNDSSTNAYKTILQSADLTTFGADVTFTLPANDGSTDQCLKTNGSGVLSFAACGSGSGSGGAETLQDAYDAGNVISTDLNASTGDIGFILADTGTDRNFTITTEDGATGYTYISRENGSGTADPGQLLLIDNLDTDRSIADGIRIIAAAGGITDGIDVSDAELTNAINVGANVISGTTANIDFTNFDVTGSTGDVTTAGNVNIAGTINLTAGTNDWTMTSSGDDFYLSYNGNDRYRIYDNGWFTFFDDGGTEIFNIGEWGTGGAFLRPGASNLVLRDDDNNDRFLISASTGDLLFYKDNGSTQSLIWDESDDAWEFNTDVDISGLATLSAGLDVAGTNTEASASSEMITAAADQKLQHQIQVNGLVPTGQSQEA